MREVDKQICSVFDDGELADAPEHGNKDRDPVNKMSVHIQYEIRQLLKRITWYATFAGRPFGSL